MGTEVGQLKFDDKGMILYTESDNGRGYTNLRFWQYSRELKERLVKLKIKLPFIVWIKLMKY